MVGRGKWEWVVYELFETVLAHWWKSGNTYKAKAKFGLGNSNMKCISFDM